MGEKSARFTKFITDTVSEDTILVFTENKWSRNKSKMRLTKKSTKKTSSAQILSEYLGALKKSQIYTGDYISLTTELGTKYKNADNISCNLHSRFFLQSNCVEPYSALYEKLIDVYSRPTDWGGVPILIQDFYEIAKNMGFSDTKEIFMLTMNDCLCRYLSNDYITFTSTGYTVIVSYLQNDLSIQSFFRKIDDDTYCIEIGENSKFLSYFNRNLKNSKGWFVNTYRQSEVLDMFDKLILYKPTERGCLM